MSDKLDFKLMTMHSTLVSIKLTDEGYEHIRNYYISNFPETGYQMFNHFCDTSMSGKVLTTSLKNFMIMFGSVMMFDRRYFESTDLVVNEMHLKDIETPCPVSPEEAVNFAMQM